MINTFRLLLIISSLFFAHSVFANAKIGGYNLSEIGQFYYDASDSGTKTPAQNVVDQLYDLNVRHIVLNPRAIMKDPRGTEIQSVTPPSDKAEERRRYMRLIKYIRSKGMTVGVRPIFFVVDANGNPLIETLPDGTKKHWWHGNIQPKDPNKWFDSFKTYLDSYLLVSKASGVEEFTIGAELYSMTVGLEDQWKEFPYGFPGRWLELLRYVRPRLAPNTRIMYDINFTDDKVSTGTIQAMGGELERWRYRLVDLANPANPAEKAIWDDLVAFWSELDAVGIDMYRSLIGKGVSVPSNYNALLGLLQETGDRYASQIDNTLAEIEMIVGKPKEIIFKEIGFRSVQNSFIDPFTWDDSRSSAAVNIQHQAVSMEAILRAFWTPNWPWFKGIYFWDVILDPSRQGTNDTGFSPLGKAESENVLRTYFGN